MLERATAPLSSFATGGQTALRAKPLTSGGSVSTLGGEKWEQLGAAGNG